jgi:hypothetical protein
MVKGIQGEEKKVSRLGIFDEELVTVFSLL